MRLVHENKRLTHLTNFEILASSAELDDPSAIAFRRTSRRSGSEKRRICAAFFGSFLSRFAAFVGFAVKFLGFRPGTAKLAEAEDLDGEIAGIVGDFEHVAEADIARRLHRLMICFDASEFASFFGERASLEKARGPQPDVDANRGHADSFARDSDGSTASAGYNLPEVNDGGGLAS